MFNQSNSQVGRTAVITAIDFSGLDMYHVFKIAFWKIDNVLSRMNLNVLSIFALVLIWHDEMNIGRFLTCFHNLYNIHTHVFSDMWSLPQLLFLHAVRLIRDLKGQLILFEFKLRLISQGCCLAQCCFDMKCSLNFLLTLHKLNDHRTLVETELFLDDLCHLGKIM